MANVGTLKELDLKPGDEVECVNGPLFGGEWTAGKRYKMTDRGLPCDRNGPQTSSLSTFRLISRATPQPKLWRDMTAEEKGALLLAAHEGKVIEFSAHEDNWHDTCGAPLWEGNLCYRIKPKPKVDTVTLYGGDTKGNNRRWGFSVQNIGPETHRITFQTIDGKPDCASIKMDEL